MDKSNFGSLITKLVDDLPINPYINDDGEIEMEEGRRLKKLKLLHITDVDIDLDYLRLIIYTVGTKYSISYF